MPLYEYRCPTCQMTFEVYKHMRQSDRAETCVCGGEGVRVFSNLNIDIGRSRKAAIGDMTVAEFDKLNAPGPDSVLVPISKRDRDDLKRTARANRKRAEQNTFNAVRKQTEMAFQKFQREGRASAANERAA